MDKTFENNVRKMRFYQKKFFKASPNDKMRRVYLSKAEYYANMVDNYLDNPGQITLF